MPGMTKGKIEKFIRHWQPLLGLVDYHIEVLITDAEELEALRGDWAQVTVDNQSRRLTIRIARDRDPEAVLSSLHHELLHAVLDPMGDVIRRLSGRVGRDLSDFALDAYADEEHKVIATFLSALRTLDTWRP